jgi:DHA1 family inner membrane transport protein
VPSRSPRELLAVLGFLSFASAYAGVVTVPLLGEIAKTFGTSPGAAASVAAAYGVPGILIPLLIGPYSDRSGRKALLVGGSLLLGVGTLTAALAPSLEILMGARIAAGIGSSIVYPMVSAAVGGSVPASDRGRALSTIIGVNTMATIVGVPAAGLIAEAGSWRLSLGLVAVLPLVAALVLTRALPDQQRGAPSVSARLLYGQIAANRSAVAALVSSLLGSIFWFSWATFFVVFFQQSYDLSLGAASSVGLTLGLGILIGSQLGGRLGDRIGHRGIAGTVILAAGALIAALTNLALPLPIAIVLNLAVSVLIGARFAANQALLSEQLPTARGTVFALSSSFASVALVAGAALGGLLVDRSGFGAIGVVCFVVGAIVSALTFTLVREHPEGARSTIDTRPRGIGPDAFKA